jgi:hypothetical protein
MQPSRDVYRPFAQIQQLRRPLDLHADRLGLVDILPILAGHCTSPRFSGTQQTRKRPNARHRAPEWVVDGGFSN